MTPELQKYYESRFSMMSTDGWAVREQSMTAADALAFVGELP